MHVVNNMMIKEADLTLTWLSFLSKISIFSVHFSLLPHLLLMKPYSNKEGKQENQITM